MLIIYLYLTIIRALGIFACRMRRYLNEVYDCSSSNILIFYNKSTTHIWTAAMSTARSHIFIPKKTNKQILQKKSPELHRKTAFYLKITFGLNLL